ncbi:MAG: (d)CMP kinase, partial [Actinomyces graevenitzii]|nr:(d)CMP kinase [Actinomyces graevenitzii]
MGIVVAIDGPSGSGKSSVSLAVARQLQLAYLDTGAMYRAAAWWCEHLGIDLEDQEGVSDAVISMPLHMDTDPDHPGLSVDGIDIAQAIREPHISAVVSKIAANLDVRAELGRRQRELIEHGAANGG